MDLDLPPVGNDYDVPPDAPAFKTPVHGRPQQSSSVLASDELETSSSAAAPQRRRKVRKIIAMDTTTELHNSDLSRWNNEYLDNMADITSTKMNYKAPLQAKLNAEHWILGAGLGGVGNGIGHGNVKSPLDVFSGASLFKALTGRDLAVTGLKRDHDATTEDETDVDQRRVRRRTEDPEELGRGDGMAFEDDGGFRGMDDDIEMAREAGEALADESTAMPWNIAAPQRGSSVGRGRPGSVTGFLASAAGPSSVGGPLTGLGGPPGSVSRLGPRLLGASPLIGRSRPLALGGDEGPSGTSGRGDDIGLGAGILGDEERDDFELYGPAAGVDTQTAGETQWQRAALDTESFNFLDFIETAIQERTQAGDDKADTVLFEELLPPNSNSKVVAAQGLLHVLSLGTKNLIAAKQTEHLGDIELRLLPAASTV